MVEFTVAKRDLFRLLERCQGAADKKSTMPVLNNILFTVDQKSVTCAATDLYIGVVGSCPAEVVRGGTLALPAKDLLDRIKAMPDGPVQIVEKENSQATIKAGGAPRRYTLHGMPGSEFPQLPKPIGNSPSLDLPAETLSQLIARTHFSISTDETRAHVNCALFEWAGDRVRMVSTDGHRLSKMEITLDGKRNTAAMLIPLKAVHELRRLIDSARAGDKDAVISITQSGPNAFFAVGGMVFSVKLVDAQFPPYQQVIPQIESMCKAVVPRGPLMDAIRAVSLAANDRTGGIKVTISRGSMRITSESPDSGNGYDEVPVDYDDSDRMVGLNGKYMLDVCGALDCDEVEMFVQGELDPCLIRPVNESDKRIYVAVVMPMRN